MGFGPPVRETVEADAFLGGSVHWHFVLEFAADLLEATVAGLEPFVAVDFLAAGDYLGLVDSRSGDDVVDGFLLI